MLIDIIIVTYFSEKEIQACLDSLLMQTIFEKCCVWVVDNASQDDTKNKVKPYVSDRITLLPLKENIGFGRAINYAAQKATGEFIYLINPDAVLKKPDDLVQLISFAEKNPQAGIIGTRVLEPGGKETKPRYAYPEAKRMHSFLEKLPGEIAWLIGASLLLRTSVFHTIKGFDPDFFLYGEEVDLCLRVRKQGLELAFNGDVTVEHIGSASANQLPSYQKKLLKANGLYLFLRKHFPLNEVRDLARRHARRAAFRYWMNAWFLPKKADMYRAEKDAARQFLCSFAENCL